MLKSKRNTRCFSFLKSLYKVISFLIRNQGHDQVPIPGLVSVNTKRPVVVIYAIGIVVISIASLQGVVSIGIGSKTICLSGNPIARGSRIPYVIPIRVTHLHVLEHILIVIATPIQSENPKLCQFGGTIRPTGSKLTRHLRSRLYLLTETDGNRRLVCTGFVGRGAGTQHEA